MILNILHRTVLWLPPRDRQKGGSQVGLISAWTADAEAGGNADQFVLLEALQGPDGNRYVENASNYLDISDRELVISKDCENPEKLSCMGR